MKRKRATSRIAAIIPAAAWLAASLTPVVGDAESRALLSLRALPIASGQYVSGFRIDTWFVHLMSVCKIPDGWSITAANEGGPGGHLEGKGQIGAAFVEGRDPPEFNALFLVDTGPPAQRSPEAPPPLRGSIDVGHYGVDKQPAALSLKARSFKLTPANRCPTPGE